jgi:restriction system protein
VSLPLLRVTAQRAYPVSELRTAVLNELGASNAATIPKEPRNSTSAEAANTVRPTGPGAAPSCPKCSLPMVRRRAESGSRLGSGFWGCTEFPRCRGVVAIGVHRDPGSAAEGAT